MKKGFIIAGFVAFMLFIGSGIALAQPLPPPPPHHHHHHGPHYVPYECVMPNGHIDCRRPGCARFCRPAPRPVPPPPPHPHYAPRPHHPAPPPPPPRPHHHGPAPHHHGPGPHR